MNFQVQHHLSGSVRKNDDDPRPDALWTEFSAFRLKEDEERGVNLVFSNV